MLKTEVADMVFATVGISSGRVAVILLHQERRLVSRPCSRDKCRQRQSRGKRLFVSRIGFDIHQRYLSGDSGPVDNHVINIPPP